MVNVPRSASLIMNVYLNEAQAMLSFKRGVQNKGRHRCKIFYSISKKNTDASWPVQNKGRHRCKIVVIQRSS
jgi:hypothetical protein